jgi:hypothetical protein
MLSQQLSTGCRWVIALPLLGAEYIPDFVVARRQWRRAVLITRSAGLEDGTPSHKFAGVSFQGRGSPSRPAPPVAGVRVLSSSSQPPSR